MGHIHRIAMTSHQPWGTWAMGHICTPLPMWSIACVPHHPWGTCTPLPLWPIAHVGSSPMGHIHPIAMTSHQPWGTWAMGHICTPLPMWPIACVVHHPWRTCTPLSMWPIINVGPISPVPHVHLCITAMCPIALWSHHPCPSIMCQNVKRCQVVKKMSNVKKSNTWTMEEVHKKIN